MCFFADIDSVRNATYVRARNQSPKFSRFRFRRCMQDISVREIPSLIQMPGDKFLEPLVLACPPQQHSSCADDSRGVVAATESCSSMVML